MTGRSSNFAHDFRFTLITSLFAIAFSLVILRLFQIQVLEHAKYALVARDQHWGQYDLPAIRGDIFSADDYLLAGTQNYYLLYGEPQKIQDKVKLASDLADYFSKIKYEALVSQSSDTAKTQDDLKNELDAQYSQALSKSLLWVPLEHKVTPEQHDQLIKMNIQGIGFESEPVRFYPEGTLAAHILGFVASDNSGQAQGYFGIEGAFNEDLKGRNGKLTEEVDASGIPILIGGLEKTDAIQGSTLYLTINRAVQYMVEQKLKEGVQKYDAKSGSVIVMDPNTGSVIALANYPTYSPSEFNDEDAAASKDAYRKTIERQDLAIAQTYEPGSIMKPMTIATGVDLGLIDATSTFNDDGPKNYSGAWINNWDGKHYGIQTIVQLLQKSNNIGAAWVGHQIGSKDLYRYLYNFGFGIRTNVELEGEDTGILRDYSTWTDIDLANISFGQGISATPLQMLNALNAIANGGFLLQPRIVSRIVDNGKVIDIPTKVIRRVIKKETSDKMIPMLEQAAEGGEAKFFVIKNYKIAGKTGTAQIPFEGKYDPNKTNASFMGFLVGSKKYSMIVKLEEPRTSIFAAETAAPLWMDITSDLVKYYNLAPDNIQASPTSLSPTPPSVPTPPTEPTSKED